ncbi:MAG: hypothetical protein NBV76_04380 [Candidatus Ochrobactrum gambitense]|nr:MAG: hypothetical protein NBV76_04380 [Candidatus Ochrobactrum gambitense]WEK15202.1 MAG: hypothetical protein P0Y54_06580 [Candidatus Ochrobactrum gambitense]
MQNLIDPKGIDEILLQNALETCISIQKARVLMPDRLLNGLSDRLLHVSFGGWLLCLGFFDHLDLMDKVRGNVALGSKCSGGGKKGKCDCCGKEFLHNQYPH